MRRVCGVYECDVPHARLSRLEKAAGGAAVSTMVGVHESAIHMLVIGFLVNQNLRRFQRCKNRC